MSGGETNLVTHRHMGGNTGVQQDLSCSGTLDGHCFGRKHFRILVCGWGRVGVLTGSLIATFVSSLWLICEQRTVPGLFICTLAASTVTGTEQASVHILDFCIISPMGPMSLV